jgi:hypothetical protein
MSLLEKPACTPDPCATSTATATAVQPDPGEVSAICVDVNDLGVQETPWGKRPQISFVFETDTRDESGLPRFLTRTFNNYALPKSALTAEIKNWLGRDISGDDKGWDLEECVGEQATLSTSEALSKTGNHYEKIEAVKPGGMVQVQASGSYERREMNW